MTQAHVVVIQGSHRRDGDTQALVDCAFGDVPIVQFRLLHCRVAPYAYDRTSLDDDFEHIAASMTLAPTIVFATPVYWYAMSGLTKTVLDRFTDLISFRKELGRKLNGKAIHLLACGTDPALPDGFVVPFSRTASYFDMRFGEAFYAQTANVGGIPEETKPLATAFGARVHRAGDVTPHLWS